MTELLGLFLFISFVLMGILLVVEGSNRNIGWFATLLLCVFISPLGAAIFVALSKRKDDESHERFMRETMAKINNKLAEMGKKEDATS